MHLRSLVLIVAAASALVAAAPGRSPAPANAPGTYCNPLPGPCRYRVELETSAGRWVTVLDRTASDEDLLIDYREVEATVASRVRLVVTAWPRGLTPGVAEFTAFGNTEPAKR